MITDALGPREPRQARWAALIPRTREGPVRHFFDDGFFDWLNHQIIMMEDYPYAGMKFTGDPELVLPPSTQWGLDGKRRIDQCSWKYFFVF